MPERPDAKRGLAIAGGAGLALIVYFWSSVSLPNVVGRSRTEAEASTHVTLVDIVSVAAAVPPIAGRPVPEVIAEVGEVGFQWQRQEELSETVASDRHARQYLLVGLPILAPEVEVSISVPVPTVVDQPGASATASLNRAGFKSQRQEVPSETTPPGRVIGTSPPAGALVDKGSTVIVIVAVPVRVLVPGVVGQRVGDATATLGRVGLKWLRREQSSERVTPGTVISTSPIAGQSVEKGASVTLVISKAVYRNSAVSHRFHRAGFEWSRPRQRGHPLLQAARETLTRGRQVSAVHRAARKLSYHRHPRPHRPRRRCRVTPLSAIYMIMRTSSATASRKTKRQRHSGVGSRVLSLRAA
jgi:PASTA domain